MVRGKSFVLLGSVAVFVARASAQRVWLVPDDTRNVGIEIGKSFYKSPSSLDFASLYFTAQGRFPVNSKVAVTVAVPYARVSVTPSYAGATTTVSTAVGNPWIGAEITSRPDFVIEAGIRPGVASDGYDAESALIVGFIGDYDRFEAWVPQTTSVRAMAHIGHAPATGTFVTGILGGTVMLARRGGEASYFANYGVRLGFRDEGRLVTLALTGRANVSHLTDGGSLDERTVHQLTFRVERTSGALRPYGSAGSFLDQGLRQGIALLATVGATLTF